MLSTKDRDRLKVLHEVKGEHRTQRAAAQQLGISDRWVRELVGRVRQEGDRGVVHVTPWRRVKDFEKDHWEWSCACFLGIAAFIHRRATNRPKQTKPWETP